ncbi:MAG: Orotidine-5'-phosphate decarboxylase [Thermodesulfobacteria bacterium]|nr:orotidine-5'-phosphate decarboxylase [Thermodesulfobacteriota bacterium]MCU4138402.1 Orotidine-5'-phosphate decarboxylase [Thermodesulfobacteriota bacterium]
MKNNLKPEEVIVFPLDVSTLDEALEWVERLNELVGVYKIGLELFTSCGPEIIKEIKKRSNNKIFLDLKLYDIPNTLSKTVKVISELDVDWLTVHALSGRIGLKEAVKSAFNNLKIIAVTILTSLDRADLMELGFNSELARDTKELVFKLAQIAYKTGCEGVVCSAKEVSKIKEFFPELLTIVPGIRWEGNEDDQLRVATPYEAILAGADYLVIGRPIRESSSPEEICKKIADEIKKAWAEKNDNTKYC